MSNMGKRKNKWGRGHMGNLQLRGFPKHLVTSFQPSSYTDGTTYKCQGICIVFPNDVLCKPIRNLARSKIAESLDVYTCIYYTL